jgi:hypothetical protein
VGDGTTTLANSQGPISLLEFNSSGTIRQTVAISTNATNGLQVSGTATSEGQIGRSADGQALMVTGYLPPFTGTGSLAGRTSAQAPRGFVTVSYNGTVSSSTTLTGSYSTDNIRNGITNGTNSWFTGSGGAGSGIVTYNGSSQTQVQDINSRVIQNVGGDLFYSTGSGTQGIYKYTGLPTVPTVSTSFLTGISGQGTSPYDFVFNDSGNVLYVADSGIGVQKFTFNGSTWSLAYNFTSAALADRAFGLHVDFSGVNPAIYWTTPTDVFKATDAGSAAVGTSILSAGTNYAFRGLETAPIPEPASSLLGGLGILCLLRRRRY